MTRAIRESDKQRACVLLGHPGASALPEPGMTSGHDILTPETWGIARVAGAVMTYCNDVNDVLRWNGVSKVYLKRACGCAVW